MSTDTQRRNRILKRVNRIPKNKLKELDEFVSRLEEDVNKKKKSLSFAGAWQDISDEIFNSFTKNLISNRKRNRGRIGE